MLTKFFHSFSYALNGVYLGMEERNMKIHVLATIIVIFLGFFFRVSLLEWSILLLCIGSVISTELCNTAIEEICDAIAPLHSDAYNKMGKPKDIGAGAVLVTSIASLLIGLLIFIPHIVSLIFVTN